MVLSVGVKTRSGVANFVRTQFRRRVVWYRCPRADHSPLLEMADQIRFVALEGTSLFRPPCGAKVSYPYTESWHEEKLEQLHTLLHKTPLSIDQIRERLEGSSRFVTENSKKPGANKRAMLRTAHLHLEMSMNVTGLLDELISMGMVGEQAISEDLHLGLGNDNTVPPL